jgi:hypothetical protein
MQHLSVNNWRRAVGHGSVTGIATKAGRQRNRGSNTGKGHEVHSPVHSIHDFRDHPASYSIVTKGSFPGDKAAWAWRSPETPHLLPRSKISGLYFHSPTHVNVMYRDNFTYMLCVRVFLYYLRHKTSAYANLDFFVRLRFYVWVKLRDFRHPPRCEICALLRCHTA